MHLYNFYTTRRDLRVEFGNVSNDDETADNEQLYEVRIIDNDRNTYQEVIDVTMLALNIDQESAFAVAWEVDHYGSCVVALGPRQTAERIAEIIRIIGIEVQVNPAVRDPFGH